MKKKNYRILLLLLSLLLLASPLSVHAETELDTTGYENAGIILYEVNTEKLLYSSVSANLKFYPGSITKLLTALTALDHLSLDTELTVESAMLDMVEYNSSTANLLEGEQLSFEQVLYAMLLPSGNDASKVTAVSAGRVILSDPSAEPKAAYDAFIAKMNEKSAALGMSASHFSNSDGYDDEANYSTPADILKLAIAAYKNDTIKNIVSQKSRLVQTNRASHYWYSTNLMLYSSFSGLSGYIGDRSGTNSLYDERVNGLKTGNTDIGGRCFAMSADDGELCVLGIFLGMGSSGDSMWKFIGKCADYAFDNYRLLELVNDDMSEYTYKIKNRGIGQEKTLLLESAESFKVLYDQNHAERIDYVMVPNEEFAELDDTDVLRLKKSVKAGDTIAYAVALDISQNNLELARIPFVALTKFRRANILDHAARLLIIFAVLALIAYAALFVLQNNGTIKKANGRKTTQKH